MIIPGNSGSKAVAIKVMSQQKSGGKAAKWAINWAMLAQIARSDNLTGVIEFFINDNVGHTIVVMSLLKEGDLNVRVKSLQEQGLGAINAIFRQILAGVAAMHTPSRELPDGIMHRDLKPGNILLDK